MAFQFPPKTLNKRRKLAAQVVWCLKLDGDCVSKANAVAVLDQRLRARGVLAPKAPTLSAMLVDLEKEEWGGLVTRKVNGRRTQGIHLNHEDAKYLPPNPFPPPAPAPVATPEPVTVAAPPPAAPVAASAPVAAVQTNGVSVPAAGELLDLADLGPEPIDLTSLEDQFEPFNTPPELRDSSSVLDKLFIAMGLINDAAIQSASQHGPEQDAVLATRLHQALEQNQTLRRQRDEARETVVAYKRTIDGLQKTNIQLKANHEALIRAAQDPRSKDGYKELARLAQTPPRTKGHF